MIDKSNLLNLYVDKHYSMAEIADELGVSVHTVNWWMKKHAIHMRSRKDAMYAKYNRDGDPFCIKTDLTPAEERLMGIGLGLYWGEGTKRSMHSVRLGNTDPELIKTFVLFLRVICGVNESKIRYALQIFNDSDPLAAIEYWLK